LTLIFTGIAVLGLGLVSSADAAAETSYTTEAACKAADYFWYAPTTPAGAAKACYTDLSDLTTALTCHNAGFYWYGTNTWDASISPSCRANTESLAVELTNAYVSWDDVVKATYRTDGKYSFKAAAVGGLNAWPGATGIGVRKIVYSVATDEADLTGRIDVQDANIGTTYSAAKDSAILKISKEEATASSRTKTDLGVVTFSVYAVIDSGTSNSATTKKILGKTKAITKDITIEAKNLDLCSLAVVTLPGALVFNGDKQTPDIRVKDGGVQLDGWNSTYSYFDYVVNEDSSDGSYYSAHSNTYPPLPLRDILNWSDADTAWVIVGGKGNYTGYVRKPFVIGKKPITVHASNAVTTKTYDGVDAIDTAMTISRGGSSIDNPKGAIKVTFEGLIDDDADNFKNTLLYRISNAKLSSAEIGVGRTATATVSLIDGGKDDQGGNTKANNYVLANGNVSYPGFEVVKRDVDALGTNVADTVAFSFSIPENHYFLGNGSTVTARGIGAVTYKSPVKNPVGSTTNNAALTVLYNYSNAGVAHFGTTTAGVLTPFVGDTTIAPKNAGTYAVKVFVAEGGSNFVNSVKHASTGFTGASKTYPLGTYTIHSAVLPVIAAAVPAYSPGVTYLPATVNVGQNEILKLSVSATSPNSGNLTYKWFLYNSATDSVEQSAQAVPYEFVVPTGTKGDYTYAVWVTNNNPAVHVAASVKSTDVRVTVTDPPTTLTGVARITVETGKTWEYTGYEIIPESDYITVELPDSNADGGWKELAYSTDYTLGGFNNINVGTAQVLATGVPGTSGTGYKGAVSTTFSIVKRVLSSEDLDFVAVRPYDGKATGAQVKVASPKTGLGEITKVTYNNSTVVPESIGVYQVVVDVKEGSNFTAGSNIYLGTYTITRGVLDTSAFEYAIPTNHVAGVAGTVYGIGNVRFVKGTGYGTLRVIYGSDTSGVVPKTAGSYQVYAIVSGGANFDAGRVLLGTYVIRNPGDAVAESSREIPGANVTDVGTVAPVKVAAASFTAGPSPVSKNGAIKFFSAKAVKGGSLYIFDANGNSVAKATAKAGTGEIASWNLKDKNGASVSEGTYAVKGTLSAKDGTKEKVSFVFSVVK